MNAKGKKLDDIRVLLVQARGVGNPMALHELQCFARQSDLRDDQFEILDALTVSLTRESLRSCDVLMVGGSGDYSVVKNDDRWIRDLIDGVRIAVEEGYPTFASCFGIQLMALALGGEVINDPDKTEVGTLDLELTDLGKLDELFSSLPEKFTAQLGHHDRISQLPQGMNILARSTLIPVQAMRVPNQPVYATQFHPELTMEANKDRYSHYCTNYTEDAIQRDQVMNSFRPSLPSNQLLKTFLSSLFATPAA